MPVERDEVGTSGRSGHGDSRRANPQRRRQARLSEVSYVG